jgi:tRNA threonylcarbamoyl adenosine modification protein YeaZ
LSDGEIVASHFEDRAKGQAEALMPVLQNLLMDAGLDWPDLTRIGVGIGPGNFTGIRISVSAARGLALGLGVPAVGVSMLESLAFGTTGEVTSLIDAKRDHVYYQMFGKNTSEPTLTEADNLPQIAGTLIGYEAERLATKFGAHHALPAHPIADSIAMIAAARKDVSTRPAPLYLRPADAAPARDTAPSLLS